MAGFGRPTAVYTQPTAVELNGWRLALNRRQLALNRRRLTLNRRRLALNRRRLTTANRRRFTVNRRRPTAVARRRARAGRTALGPLERSRGCYGFPGSACGDAFLGQDPRESGQQMLRIRLSLHTGPKRRSSSPALPFSSAFS